ncbi:hypothetical protein CKO23_13440 [Thiocystis violacea]|nr:hypothetical protein [Thiocystis violacea]
MLGAFLVTLLALAWLFERQDSWREAVLDAESGAASLAYLRAMIAAHPADVELRLKLARELAKAGDWGTAKAALEPVLRTADGVHAEVWLERLRIEQMELNRLDAADGRRETMMNALVGDLEALVETAGATAQLPELAKLALELEQPRLAAKVYERLARSGPESEATRWLREAGRWYLAARAPLRAAGVLHAAVVRSTRPSEAQEAALETLQALRAGDAGAQALDVSARYLERFPHSRRLLEAAIVIARSEAAVQDAYAWGQRRLALDPDDPLWVARVRRLALDAGDMAEALRLTQRLLERDPASPESRRLLAETAEWAGRPAVALPNWLWLAKRDPAGSGVTRGLALARALGNDQALIRLLELASATCALEPVELGELTQACLRAPAISEGVALLTRYLKRHDDQTPAWKALAELREQDGDVPGAVDAWRRVASDPGERIPATLRLSDLLWRSGKRDAAWAALTAVQPAPDAKHGDYWRMLADQAWETKRVAQSAAAYRLLWAGGSAEPLVAERLVLLVSQAATAGETIALAEAAFRRVREPRLLLLGMDAALRAGRPKDLRALLDIAEQERGRFPALASYWQQLGSIEQGRGRSREARGAYQKALELAPESQDVKAALLWLAINDDDHRQLRTLLASWEAEAAASPALWQPFAVGLSKLGAEDRALAWFRRRAQRQPQDSDALLDYADALVKVGRDDDALKLRKAAYQLVRKKLAMPLD